jgi:hypothetical protein
MINTTAMQFVNGVQNVIGSENITISVKDLPMITDSIIKTSAEAAIIFYFIGVGSALIFAFVCFLIWKKANPKNQKYFSSEEKEKLAALEHEQWSHWTGYMLNNLTPENIERWKKQILTPYSELSEREKISDRDWAEKVLQILSGGSYDLDIATFQEKDRDQ